MFRVTGFWLMDSWIYTAVENLAQWCLKRHANVDQKLPTSLPLRAVRRHVWRAIVPEVLELFWSSYNILTCRSKYSNCVFHWGICQSYKMGPVLTDSSAVPKIHRNIVKLWLVGIWLKFEKLESELWLCGFLLNVFRWKHTYANSKKTESVLYRLY